MLGQHSVFESASEILTRLLSVELSPKQIQRISEFYGKQIDPIVAANHTQYIPQLPPSKASDDVAYVMMDGSMVYTREDQWKEMKLARVFYQSQNIDIQKNRKEIVRSVYVSHLGGVDQFFPKLERHLSLVRTKKVFIADGAKWIWNWVEDNYPGAVQILDFYHAIEKIEALARLHFRNEEKKKNWLQTQKNLLLEDQVRQVIENVNMLRTLNHPAMEAKQVVVSYYLEHEDRMRYKTFRAQGHLIGSGAIEAAHRNVVHQRIKLSGQKWSVSGAQAIANLRCYHQSGAWNIIETLIRRAA